MSIHPSPPSCTMHQMILEPVIQSEVSQKEKSIIYEHVHMEPRKMVLMNLFAGQEWRHRCREQICGHSKVSWGQNELKQQHEVYTLPCVKQIASGKLLYNTRTPARRSVMACGMGRRLRREGIYVYLRLIHIVLWQKPTQHCRAIIFQLKVKFFFLNLWRRVKRNATTGELTQPNLPKLSKNYGFPARISCQPIPDELAAK